MVLAREDGDFPWRFVSLPEGPIWKYNRGKKAQKEHTLGWKPPSPQKKGHHQDDMKHHFGAPKNPCTEKPLRTCHIFTFRKGGGQHKAYHLFFKNCHQKQQIMIFIN